MQTQLLKFGYPPPGGQVPVDFYSQSYYKGVRDHASRIVSFGQAKDKKKPTIKTRFALRHAELGAGF